MSNMITIRRVAAVLLLRVTAAQGQLVSAKVTPFAEFKGERISDVLVAPAGNIIAYMSQDELRLYNAVTHASFPVAKGDISLFAWSPRGDAFAFIRDRDSKYAGNLWIQTVNPTTGATTGPAQRVTMTKTEEGGVFSPDGKSIAFVSSEKQEGVIIVPATGGKERVVTRLSTHADVVSWSAKDNTIYLSVADMSPARKAAFNLEALNPTTGARKYIMPLGGCYRFSQQGPYAFDFNCSPTAADSVKRLFELSGGVVGTFLLPRGYRATAWIGGAPAVLAQQVDAPAVLRTVSVTGGPSRTISVIASADRHPTFSPDGRTIALVSEKAGAQFITLMNVGGANRSDFRVAGSISDTPLQWSPDGRYVAFHVRGGGTMGGNLGIVDVAQGTIRNLITNPESVTVSTYAWAKDSRAVLYLQLTKPSAAAGTRRIRLERTTLDGQTRELRDVTPVLQLRGLRYSLFPNDSTFIALTQDSLYIVPLGGSVIRTYADGSRNRWEPALSPDGETLAAPYAAPGDTYHYSAIELTSLRDGSRRVVPLPFEASTGLNAVPRYLPDGKHLVVASAPAAGRPKMIWMVSINGDPARVIDTLATTPMPTSMGLSADGNTIVFTRPGAPTTTLIKADFSSLVRP